MRLNRIALLAASWLVMAIVAGCGGQLSFLTGKDAAPAGPSPTFSADVFAQKDLTKVALQASDLPRGYALVSELTTLTDMKQVFLANIAVDSNLLAGCDVAYALGSSDAGLQRAFDNAIFVYADQAQARQAFQSLSTSFAATRLDFPALGSESVASHQEVPALGNPNVLTYKESVVWRQDSVVVLLYTQGGEAATQQLGTLAQAIQGRILGN
jgi:hypothetical protein